METRTWNARLQPMGIYRTGGFSLEYGYCPSAVADCATKNGNVLRQVIGQAGSVTQSYQYDEYARLTKASEGTTVYQTYGYDIFSNWYVSGSQTWTPGSFTPQASTNFNKATNQLNLPGLTGYDADGNQKTLGAYELRYDGEGRLLSSKLNSVTTTYSYDGEGNRVKKSSPSRELVMAYGAEGDLVAEYDSAPSGWTGKRYVAQDQARYISSAQDSGFRDSRSH